MIRFVNLLEEREKDGELSMATVIQPTCQAEKLDELV